MKNSFWDVKLKYNDSPCKFYNEKGEMINIYNLINKEELTIPEGVVKLEDNIIDVVETMDLKKVVFSSTLQDIGEGNFIDIRSLKEVVINKNFKFENGCLYSRNYEKLFFCLKDIEGEIQVNNNCKELSSFAFNDCKNLTKVILPNEMQKIGTCCFMNCSKLRQVIMPQKVDILRTHLFANCYDLERINLPENIETLKFELFAFCSNLKELKIPCSVKEIEDNNDERLTFVDKNTILLLEKRNQDIEEYAKKYDLKIKYGEIDKEYRC